MYSNDIYYIERAAKRIIIGIVLSIAVIVCNFIATYEAPEPMSSPIAGVVENADGAQIYFSDGTGYYLEK